MLALVRVIIFDCSVTLPASSVDTFSRRIRRYSPDEFNLLATLGEESSQLVGHKEISGGISRQTPPFTTNSVQKSIGSIPVSLGASSSHFLRVIAATFMESVALDSHRTVTHARSFRCVSLTLMTPHYLGADGDPSKPFFLHVWRLASLPSCLHQARDACSFCTIRSSNVLTAYDGFQAAFAGSFQSQKSWCPLGCPWRGRLMQLYQLAIKGGVRQG